MKFPIDYDWTGAGTSVSRLGHADLGIANLHDMREHAEMIENLDPSVPLISDADTGYEGKVYFRYPTTPLQKSWHPKSSPLSNKD